ncbi:MAG: L-serine ammonia-lyase, iron-sulfur-dependent, subunit alpha [Lawsonibacter sp.]|nr:L-serine ammonia-lyase, iron-sulfur-dependent, subunit alpha [Lawsonibacter sp.]
MDQKIYQTYVHILKSELTPALGCTEPIAIAYAAARARLLLDGAMPEHCTVRCSGNIVKNVKGVVVPNSGGQRGIDVAAVLGLLGGDADKKLAVLESITEEDQKEAQRLLHQNFCDCELVQGVANLYIEVELTAGSHSSLVKIEDYHSNITELRKDGVVIFQKGTSENQNAESEPDKSLLNVRDILEFGETFDLEDLREVLERQEEYNSAIAEEGLRHPYGAEVGRVLLGTRAHTEAPTKLKAKAFAAAGSDARMGGCSLPVVINSGSGNQGITITMPIKVYADAYQISHERFLRALAVGNLISIHQKKYIGSLSAYCGAVSAACGAGAAITWMLGSSEMMGGTYEEVSNTITTTIATIGGMVCDGAKSSCAAKISTAVEAALTAYQMSTRNKGFQSGEGLVKDDVEETIASVGRMGRQGMSATDIEILNIMLEK